MTERSTQVAHCLLAIEMELRELGYWQDTQLEAAAYASEMPFCHDTMELPQWLQFVFIRRMQMLLESASPLPGNCAITPYAEEYFQPSGERTQALLALLEEIDKLLTVGDQAAE